VAPVTDTQAVERAPAPEPGGAAGEEVASSDRDARIAYASLTGMAICFGGTWVAADIAVETLPPFTIAAIRFGLASIVLWLGACALGMRLAPLRRSDLPLVLGLGLTAIAGYNYLFLTGLTLAPATDGSLIVPGLAPVATALLAAPVLGERLRRGTLAGLVLAIVGLLLVVNPPGGGASGERLLGDAMFLGGAVLWGIYSVLGRIAAMRFDPVSATLYGAVAGTIVLLPLAFAEGGASRVLHADLGGWLGIGYLAVFGTVGGFVGLHVGIRRIGASRAAAFALLVPVFGVSSSAWLLGEPLAPLTLVGGVVILAGLWLVERAGSH
jgi:drug/metabolite transporter (DMT)-like permease